MSPEYETLLVAGTKQYSEESSEFITQSLGVSFISIPEMQREINFANDLIAYRKIKKIISDFKPDIVHTHAAKAGTLGRLAAHSLKVPVIVHTFHGHVFHSYFNPVKSKIFLNIERYLARRSTAIVAISEKQKKELGMKYKVCVPEKITVVPLGFDLGKFQGNIPEKRKMFREKYFVCEDEIAIGIIGRLVPIKNHVMFLKAMKRVFGATTKKVRVFIIGDGESRAPLLELAEKLNFDFTYFPDDERKAQVTFTSWMKDADVAVSGCDIIALTSYNEGTPVSLIEAQAGNKPVVSTKAGGTENVVVPDVTALLCNSADEKTFAENSLKLVEDDALRKKMSEQGWEFVKEKFHYTQLVNNMSKLYNRLLHS
jgi:glycosyltransferase involved in cell wall biosynthesis